MIITGDRLTNAAPSFDQQNNEPIVSVELDGQGARIMRDTTREAVKRRMAVMTSGLPFSISSTAMRRLTASRVVSRMMRAPWPSSSTLTMGSLFCWSKLGAALVRRSPVRMTFFESSSGSAFLPRRSMNNSVPNGILPFIASSIFFGS